MVGITAYNEQVNIAHILGQIMRQKRENFILKKILVISDGSTDNTVQIVRALAQSNKYIHLIADPTNRGKQFRVNQIFSMAKYDALMAFDADIGLVGDRVIDRAVEVMMTDPASQLISVHQEPLKAKTLIGKIIHASFKMWDYVRLGVPGYQSVHNFYDSATLYRGTFARTLKIPETVTDGRTYQYIMAVRKNGFRFIRDVYVTYWPPVTLRDWLSLTRRGFGKPQPVLEKMFGVKVESYYIIPRKYVFRGLGECFRRHPLYTPVAIVMGFIMGKVAVHLYHPHSALWEITVDSKLPLPL